MLTAATTYVGMTSNSRIQEMVNTLELQLTIVLQCTKSLTILSPASIVGDQRNPCHRFLLVEMI